MVEQGWRTTESPLKKRAMDLLPEIRTEMVHEYVETFCLSVSDDYFYDLANAELE